MAVAPVTGQELAQRLQSAVQDSVEEWDNGAVWVKPDCLEAAAHFLRDDPDLDFRFLNAISAVDFIEHFEVVYHLTSLRASTRRSSRRRCLGVKSCLCLRCIKSGGARTFRSGRSGT